MKTILSLFFGLGLLIFVACNGRSPSASVNPPIAEDSTANQYTGSPLLDNLTDQINQNPDAAELYLQRGSLFYERNEYQAAIVDLQRVLDLDSTNYEAWHLLADAYLDSQQSRLALDALEAALRLDSTRIPTLLKFSEFQLILRQYEGSRKVAERVLSLDAYHPEGYYMLGMNYKEVGDTARAINSFQTTVEQDPYHIDAYRQLGNLFDYLRNPIALEYFDNALRIDSTDEGALFGKAWYFHQRNSFDDAKTWYDKAAALYPYNPDIHFNNGFLHLEMKDYETAHKYFDLSVNVEPAYGKGWYFRGIASEYLGNRAAAIEDYRQAANLMENNQQALDALERLE